MAPVRAFRETGSNAANVTDDFGVACSRCPEQVRDPDATRSMKRYREKATGSPLVQGYPRIFKMAALFVCKPPPVGAF